MIGHVVQTCMLPKMALTRSIVARCVIGRAWTSFTPAVP
jgi:hypothetical protein